MLILKSFQMSGVKANSLNPTFSSQQRAPSSVTLRVSPALQRGPSHDQFQRTHTPVRFGSAMPPPQSPGGGQNPWDQYWGDDSDDAEIGWDRYQGEHGGFLQAPQPEEESRQAPHPQRGHRKDGTLSMTPNAIKQREKRQADALDKIIETGEIPQGGSRKDGTLSMTPNAIKRREKRRQRDCRKDFHDLGFL